ncbi:TPA: hypothetical protein I8Y18_003421 [Raoultella ornithinolytica]|nr:hypothetical protein [Raoultella ornithinolytica]
MSNKGREDCVTDVFKSQVRNACRDDLIASLNDRDRDINADTLFGVCDRFCLVEMNRTTEMFVMKPKSQQSAFSAMEH